MKYTKLFVFILLFAFGFAKAQQFKPISLEGVVNYEYYPNMLWGINFSNDGNYYSIDENYNLIKYDLIKGKEIKRILNFRDLAIPKLDMYNYEFDNSNTQLLLISEKQKIYRHSFTAKYYVYNLTTNKLTELSYNGRQQVASFSPDGKKVAFVRENNIFIKDLEKNEETQITFDGEKNKILNGIPDWVYEEEFQFSKAYDWSADGKYLAYIKFDESQVKEFSLMMYAGEKPKLKQYELYPGLYTYKYPKAGEDNSKVSVFVYNLTTKETTKVDIGNDTDIYIPRIKWNIYEGWLGVYKLNRLQNHFEMLVYNPTTNKTEKLFEETNKYYIGDEFYDNIFFTSNNIILLSERDGWRHIYIYNNKGVFERQLTKGNFDVLKIYGYDEKNKIVYYQASTENPTNTEIFAATIDGKKITKLTSEIGSNDASFNSDFKYFINEFSNITTPNVFELKNSNGKTIRVLENNAEFKTDISSYGNFGVRIEKFKTSEGVELYGKWIFPPNFDKTQKYPVLVTQYSGPNSQSVKNQWDFGWEEYLAQQGIIIFTVDTRGTAARGEEFRKITYKNLGKYETIDLIETAKYLSTLNFVDKNRIGIWGWSYGGFMVLNAMTKGNGIYKVGISVAAVTSWRYYDNIYTERYNGLPQDNPQGYDDNSPLNNVDGFKGELLLIFGTADDNVHPQNSYEFIEKMVQANKQFRMFSYTNRNHSIYGGNTRLHLYKMKTDFLIEKFSLKNEN